MPTLLALTPRETRAKTEDGAAAVAASSSSLSSSSSSSSSTKPSAHNLRYRHLTLSSTTDCNGYVTATDWSQTGSWGSHPLTFGDGGKGGAAATAVTPELIRRLRRQDERYVVCDADAVTDLALRSYARPSEWPADEDRGTGSGSGGGGGREEEEAKEARGRSRGPRDAPGSFASGTGP